ncbi:unnamed protein product [Phytophthora fragariaefolia]|uniref:Unnamed protein product n=1 Tax=Phytophthora fragariaefolia TaxID=1490495 RepID=A0A9W6XXP7_9STRA|nr:unnamed protein product [Phytophthora fragariaefolia]
MCNGITKSGKRCQRKAEWCSQHQNQKPTEEPVAEEIVKETSVVAEDDEQNNAEPELIVAKKEIVSENIVSPMSPNATIPITTTESKPAIVEAGKSESVENNSIVEEFHVQVFECKHDAKKTHAVFSTAGAYKKAFEILISQDRKLRLFPKIADVDTTNMGVSVDFQFYTCSQETLDNAKDGDDIKWRRFLLLQSKDYDAYLFDLCSLINENWFKDRDNIWNFTRMVYQMQGDATMNRQTYAAILANKFGKHFNESVAMTQYDSEGRETKYPVKVSISKLKAIAGGTDNTGYMAWKVKYEPEPIKGEKPKKEMDARVSDEDTLRNIKLLELIANATSIPAEELKAAITDESIDFAFEWCERYIKPTNRPIADDFHKWGLIVKYMHCYKFPDDDTAAKLLAMVVDLYFVIMVNGERYRRVDLTKDVSNAEMTKELIDPLKSMLFHINSRDKPISASALMVQQLPYFHMYESFVVSFEKLGDNSDVSVFNSCVPFKAQMVECNNDYTVCDGIRTFIKEIICDNHKALYNQMMTWLAKMVQYPDSKTEMLPILYSALEGCGKTCFTDLLLAIFGIHSVDVSAGSIDSLVNERRSHLIGTKLCIVNEVREMKNSFGQNHEALKSLLTDKLMSVRPLYANKITVKMFLSRCQDKAYFKNLYDNSIGNTKVINTFYTYLMREIKVKRGPMDGIVQTEAQKEFRETTEDNVARFWSHVLTELIGVDALSKSEAYSNYSSWCESQGEQPMRAGLLGSNTKGIRFAIDARSGIYRFWKIVRESKPNVVG